MIRTAFVLGAGLGTRLKSLTARRPKPLIPVVNRPLISYAFDHLIGAGVERLVVNTHWRAEAYGTAFPDASHRGVPIAFRDESPDVLETAGGIKNVADVLGAGLGTRLKSITARRPKPLIPVVNRPLISYAFDHLVEAGVERLIVNTHWRAEAYGTAFPGASHRGAPIAFRHESPDVLDTAGGIKNVEDLVGGAPFIVYNGDILTDLPLAPALAHHAASGNEVTMILRSQDGPLQITLDESSGRIADIGRRLDPTREPRFLFTGIYLVNPEFLRRIPAATKISVVPIFCEMIRAHAKLGGIVIDDGHWWDLGTREQYLAVHDAMGKRTSNIEHRTSNIELPPWIAPSAQISPAAKIEGATAIGADARIGAGAHLRDCLIWENAEVAPGAQLERCIVTDGARVSGSHRDRDFSQVGAVDAGRE